MIVINKTFDAEEYYNEHIKDNKNYYENIRNDKYYCINVLKCQIISGDIYPIIIESMDKSNPAYYRSLEFYNSVINNTETITELNEVEYLNFVIGLRDLCYLRYNFNMLDYDHILNKINLETNIDYLINDTYLMYPSLTHTKQRWIDLKDIGNENSQLFIKKCDKVYVFVNPLYLSYHNIEEWNHNDVFERCKEGLFSESESNLFKHHVIYMCLTELIFSKKIDKMYDGVYKIDFEQRFGPDAFKLCSYSNMKNEERGGSRALYYNVECAEYLTNQIKNLEIFGDDFLGVNCVFRLNKFVPGDSIFKQHYDSPYFDKSENVYSKYTMLLYLSDCINYLGVLTIEELVISNIKHNTCIIFDQKYIHEGRPSINSEKIFIRTELLFKYDPLKDVHINSDMAIIFNSACYLSIYKTIYNSQLLSKYCDEYFTKYNKYKRNIHIDENNIIFLEKTVNSEYNFLTNGHYFVFNKNSNIKSAIYITLCDYFNTNNLKITLSDIIENKPFEEIIKSTNIVKLPELNDIINNSYDDISYSLKEARCCWSHSDPNTYDYNKCPLGFFNAEQKALSDNNTEHSIVIYDKRMFLSPKNIIIKNNKIIINEKIKRMNYASCQMNWFVEPEFMEIGNTLPPIHICTEFEQLVLSIDTFNNNFVIN